MHFRPAGSSCRVDNIKFAESMLAYDLHFFGVLPCLSKQHSENDRIYSPRYADLREERVESGKGDGIAACM